MAEPSPQDLYDAGRAVMIVRRPDLVVHPGDITDVMLWGQVAMAEVVLLRGARLVAATYLDSAEGENLTQLARDHWGVERHEAVAAVGTVRFSRDSGPAGTIPAGTRVATAAGPGGDFEIFTTDQDLVVSEDEGGEVAATAEEAGRDGNVEPGAITRILDDLFDEFDVDNEDRFAGGAEAESDEDLRGRVRAVNREIRRATKAAIEVGARQVDTVARVSVAEEDGGIVRAFVADAEGNSNAQMINDVLRELEDWRAAGVPIQVSGGVVFEQSIEVSLVVRAGVSTAAIADQVRRAISSAVSQLAPGETLYRSRITSAARDVDRTGIVDVEVVTPATDVAPDEAEVIRSPVGKVSVT